MNVGRWLWPFVSWRLHKTQTIAKFKPAFNRIEQVDGILELCFIGCVHINSNFQLLENFSFNLRAVLESVAVKLYLYLGEDFVF